MSTLPGRALLFASLLPCGIASAQSIAQRVAAVRRGTVELRFAARPGVCGDGRHFLSLGRSMIGEGIAVNRGNFAATCLPGPVRVRMQVGEGTLSDLRTYVGPVSARGNDTPATDLGVVPAREAAAYFLQVAATASSRPSDRAILAAVLADSSSVWRGLLAVARDTETRSHATRNNAAFWLGRFTAATVAGHPEDLDETDDDDGEDDRSDARTSAVFALSQLRNREGIAPLIQVARTNRDARVRKSALFWLGQSGDPRALDLFEEILAR
jgi:hypothetical protein